MKRALFAILSAMTLASGPALAHHSSADFVQNQSVSLEGRVEGILFANPHVVLKVRANDSNTYVAVWRSAYQLERSGVTSATLRIGDRVVIRGCPSRDSATHALSLLTEVRRPSDGWRWPNQ